jgi:hypothetical protein
MKNLLIFIVILSSKLFASDTALISCAPAKKNVSVYKPALFFSARDGDWWSASTWAGGQVPGELDIVTVSHNLTSNNRSVIIRGKLISKKMGLRFSNIIEKTMTGGMMTPPPDDVGLIVLDDGQLQLEGKEKKAWTNVVGSVFKGATSIAVKDLSGWEIGDEIAIVPTRTPGDTRNWDDNKNRPDDSFEKEFERRTITSISGNKVTFSQPLLYDHLQVVSSVKTWTAEIMNLTRSIVIEGTQSGYSHIFIRSGKPQTIKYVEGRYLGPRHPGRRAGPLIQGLYGLHFHHCMDGSKGSVVQGNAFHDLRNRVYVPHFSNGIRFKDNVAFNSYEAMFWWDFQDQSHAIIYDGNLAALVVSNGLDSKAPGGFDLGQGDDNVARNNVSVYTHNGDEHNQGAYTWNANNESNGWEFIGNLSHSNRSGLFIWQNTGNNHTVLKHEWYNNFLAAHEGAYINSYLFSEGIVYASPFSIEASPGNTSPKYERMIFDGGNQVDYLVIAVSSPVLAGSNIFRDCIFTGQRKAVFLMNTEIFPGENGQKIIDVVRPEYTGKLIDYGPKSIYSSYFKVQPKSGQPFQVSQSGTVNIPVFTATTYGTGTGLLGKYYNGANFDKYAFERIDPSLKFMGWRPDRSNSPNGVHYKINPVGPYSIIWTGEIETQYPGVNQYAVESWGGVKLWIDDILILDRWHEFDRRITRDAAPITLKAGKKYKIRVEHFDTSGNRGFQLLQKLNDKYLNVPMSQLYPSVDPTRDPDRSLTGNAGPG